jgi:hypothetical protein
MIVLKKSVLTNRDGGGQSSRSWQRLQDDTGGKRITAPVTWSDRSAPRRSTSLARSATVRRRTALNVVAFYPSTQASAHPPSSLRATGSDQRRAPLASPRAGHRRNRTAASPRRSHSTPYPGRAGDTAKPRATSGKS